MPHIHTEPNQHDHTVTIYIIRNDGDEPRALMLMHKTLHRLMPAGVHIELHETPWQAVAHELEEETGYTFSQLGLFQPIDRIQRLTKATLHPQPVVMNTQQYIPDSHWHSDTAYAFITQQEPAQDIGEDESTDVRWLTRAEIDALTDDETFSCNQQVYQYIFDRVLPTWERVDPTSFALDRTAS